MADDKAADMDFNFSDANFDMSAAGGDFEMPSMDLGDAGGDFKFDAGDDGGFNFGATEGDDDAAAGGGGGAVGGDFNFDNMSMPSFSGGDDAGDNKGEPGAAAASAKKDAAAVSASASNPMTDDPLNSAMTDMTSTTDIPMMGLGMSQGSSQGSSSQGRSKTRKSSRSRSKSKGRAAGTDTARAAAPSSTNVGGVTRVTPAKTRRSKKQQQQTPKDATDEGQQATTPAKDATMDVQIEGSGSGAKRKNANDEGAAATTVAKKPRTPKHEGPGESLRATKDMMRASSGVTTGAASDEGAQATGAATGANTAIVSGAAISQQQPPQTPVTQDAKKEKRTSHKSSGKSRSSKKRATSSSGGGTSTSSHAAAAASSSASSSHHKSEKKHKSKSASLHKDTPRSSASTETNVSLQEIVSEAQARMNDITETMTRIEKELHEKTSKLAGDFVQQMFGMCNNFGMNCQQQILVMNQVAYRNDHLRKNVCKALELSNRLRGMQQMKNQLSSIKDSFCPNL